MKDYRYGGFASLMKRKSGRSNLLRRIEELEARSVDGSGLVPHSQQWLAFWQQQFHLYETGQAHAPLTLEAVRAIMWATLDDDDEGARAELPEEDLAPVGG